MRPDGYLVPGFIAADVIVDEVARGFKVTRDEIMGDSRERHVCVARSCAMAVVREHTNWSWPVIGRYFGRHHTTVMAQVGRVMADPTLAEGVRQVIEELSPPPRLFAVEASA